MGTVGTRRAVVVLAAGVLWPVTACTALPPGGTGVTEGGPVAFVAERADEGMDALLTGSVDVSDACLTIVDELGQRWLPVFQRPRTTWDGEGLTYGGERYTDGSRISLGGGGLADLADVDHVPEGCAFDEAFLVAP